MHRKVSYTTFAGIDRSRAKVANAIRHANDNAWLESRKADAKGTTIVLSMEDAEELLKRLDAVVQSPVVAR